jgi:hypothetical protein
MDKLSSQRCSPPVTFIIVEMEETILRLADLFKESCGMSAIEFNDFNERFGNLLLRAWTSEDYVDTLLHDPRRALAEVGLAVPPSTEVIVERRADTDGIVSEDVGDEVIRRQHEYWLRAVESGRLMLYVPEVPEVDLSEMEDSELDFIAGGRTNVRVCCVQLCL